MTLKNESKSFDLFENYLYLKNAFNNDLTEELSEQNYDNYAINITENKQLSYMF